MGELTTAIRAELVKAFGQELTELAGVRMTRLTAALEPGDTTANVESTYLMEEAGEVFVQGLEYPRVTYTGKTDTTLTGVTLDPYETETAGMGSAVVDWNRTFSRIEEARADLLVSLAWGKALDRIARNYNVGRAGSWMSDTVFRNLVLTLAYLDNCTWWAVWRVVDAWTDPFRVTGTSTVNAQTISAGTFTAEHIGRYVYVTDTDDDATVRTHRINTVTGGNAVLEHRNGPYWVDADYASASRAWVLLPFILDTDPDENGQLPCALYVRVSAPPLTAPPNYVQDNSAAEYAAVTPPALNDGGVNDIESEPGAAGDDYSGYVMEDADSEGSDLEPGYPFYLGGGGFEHLQSILEDVVAEGVRVEVVQLPE